MLNRLNLSASCLALSLSLAVLSPLDMAMGMEPAYEEAKPVGPKAIKCKIDAFNIAQTAYKAEDYERVLPYVERSIELGGKAAWTLLGHIYRKGTPSITKDVDKAYRCYQKGAAASTPFWKAEAEFYLAVMCFKGKGTPQDYEAAAIEFKKIATSKYDVAPNAEKYLNSICFINENKENTIKIMYHRAIDRYNKFKANQSTDNNGAEFLEIYLDFQYIADDHLNLYQDKAQRYVNKLFMKEPKSFSGVAPTSNKALSDFQQARADYRFKEANRLYNAGGKDADKAIIMFQNMATDTTNTFKRHAFLELATINYQQKKYEDAFQMFEVISTETGNPFKDEAIWKIYKMYRNGLGVNVDLDAANAILNNFEQQDTHKVRAMFETAKSYYHNSTPDISGAREVLEKILKISVLSDKDKAEANFKLGKLHYKNRQNFSQQHNSYKTETYKATGYWREAASKESAGKGSAKASVKLTEMILNGEFMGNAFTYCSQANRIIVNGAKEWCSPANRIKQIANSWFHLGVIYLHGLSAEGRNMNEAFRAFSQYFPMNSKYGCKTRYKKIPDFLEKWILLSRILQVDELTKDIMSRGILLEGKPDWKKTIQ